MNGWRQPLETMVFRWFLGHATIGNDGFRCLSTIGPTMEWLSTIEQVKRNHWKNETFNCSKVSFWLKCQIIISFCDHHVGHHNVVSTLERAQRRWHNGNPKLLRTYEPTRTYPVGAIDTCVSKNCLSRFLLKDNNMNVGVSTVQNLISVSMFIKPLKLFYKCLCVCHLKLWWM